MKKEDKELLFQDLCGRLPYGVKIDVIYSKDSGSSLRASLCFEGINILNTDILGIFLQSEIYIKPYLFPLSSMTEEQKKEFKEISKCKYEIGNYGGFDSEGVYLIEIGRYEYEYDINTAIEEFYFNHEIINWLNKNHFDYRDMIGKGLAIDCTNLNIY